MASKSGRGEKKAEEEKEEKEGQKTDIASVSFQPARLRVSVVENAHHVTLALTRSVSVTGDDYDQAPG